MIESLLRFKNVTDNKIHSNSRKKLDHNMLALLYSCFRVLTLNSTRRYLVQGRNCKSKHITESAAPVTQANAIMRKTEVGFENKKHPLSVKKHKDKLQTTKL